MTGGGSGLLEYRLRGDGSDLGFPLWNTDEEAEWEEDEEMKR